MKYIVLVAVLLCTVILLSGCNIIRPLFGIVGTVKEIEKRNNDYISMTSAELEALTDEDLFDAAWARTCAKVYNYENLLDGINSLTGAEKTFYIAEYYEMEVNNGGLCQFFVNSSREVAPYLDECLSETGAEEHKALFNSFITENKINIYDLSSFIIDDTAEYEYQTERYPFDDFDNAFYELTPIQEYLIPYIRNHISEF